VTTSLGSGEEITCLGVSRLPVYGAGLPGTTNMMMTILVVEVYHVLFHNLAEKWRGGWRVTSGGRGI
jgi:hypothetical protein